MFQKGNQLSKGLVNNPKGRPSAFQEFEAARKLHEYLDNDQDVEALEAKVKGKKYSGWDIIKLRALKGSERLGHVIINKVVPDLHKVEGTLDASIESSQANPELDKIREEYEAKLRNTVITGMASTSVPDASITNTTSIPE